MKTLEVIHLRLAGDDPGRLADEVRGAAGEAAESLEVLVYRHAKIEGDLLVHLFRPGAEQQDAAPRTRPGSEADGLGSEDEPSELGLRLASLLRRYGLVEHSVWVGLEGTGGGRP